MKGEVYRSATVVHPALEGHDALGHQRQVLNGIAANSHVVSLVGDDVQTGLESRHDKEDVRAEKFKTCAGWRASPSSLATTYTLEEAL
jgi:hypothetical protein